MLFLHWSEDLSVNVAEIDEQHRKIVMMLNILYEVYSSGRSLEIQKKIVCDTLTCVNSHFYAEGQLMEQLHHPGCLLHKAEHARFSEIASELRERMEDDGFVLDLDVIESLRLWLHNHIMKADMQYVPIGH